MTDHDEGEEAWMQAIRDAHSRIAALESVLAMLVWVLNKNKVMWSDEFSEELAKMEKGAKIQNGESGYIRELREMKERIEAIAPRTKPKE